MKCRVDQNGVRDHSTHCFVAAEEVDRLIEVGIRETVEEGVSRLVNFFAVRLQFRHVVSRHSIPVWFLTLFQTQLRAQPPVFKIRSLPWISSLKAQSSPEIVCP